MHGALEFSCFLVWHRLMGTHFGGYFVNGLPASLYENFLRAFPFQCFNFMR